MKGKQPKKREHYVLRMTDGTLVDVTREVYLEWYRSQRRERYQNFHLALMHEMNG